jgi:hypothetical protein
MQRNAREMRLRRQALPQDSAPRKRWRARIRGRLYVFFFKLT